MSSMIIVRFWDRRMSDWLRHIRRATIMTATVFLYALTSIISGYYAGGFYTRYGGWCLSSIESMMVVELIWSLGRNWVRCIFVTAGLWPGAVALIGVSVNFVAVYYVSTRAIPFVTMVRPLLFVISRSSLTKSILACHPINMVLPCFPIDPSRRHHRKELGRGA